MEYSASDAAAAVANALSGPDMGCFAVDAGNPATRAFNAHFAFDNTCAFERRTYCSRELAMRRAEGVDRAPESRTK